jgi:hypothetical protein
MTWIKQEIIVPAEPQRVKFIEVLKCDSCGELARCGSFITDKLFGVRTEEWVQIERVCCEVASDHHAKKILTLTWDICPKCFDSHVRPALDAIATPRQKNEGPG